MIWKSIIAGIIVFGTSIGVGQAVAQVADVPASLQDRTEVRFYGESGPVKKDLEEAIKDGSIATQTYEVQPNDTLGKIFVKQGLRADPNSVEVTNALNNYNLKPNSLVPGQKILILSKGETEQPYDYKTWGLVVDAEKKALLDEEFQQLRSRKLEMAKWASSSVSSPNATAVYEDYRQILSKMGDLRVTGYAVDPASLDALHNAMADVNAKFKSVSLDVSWQPTEKDFRDLAVIKGELTNQVLYASSLDQARVPVEAVTRSAISGDEVANLSVCYRLAMEYRRHKIQNPDTEPDWDCLFSFSTLSSPAKAVFKYNTRFAIWVEQDGELVSDYHILNMRPNEKDGRFRFELEINGLRP